MSCVEICPNCKSKIIDSCHCYICGYNTLSTLNKGPDALLNQEPNDNLKGIFDMKYFLFYYSSDCCGFEQEGPFENKADVMKFIENNIAIDTPLKEIILVRGERILLKRIITEA